MFVIDSLAPSGNAHSLNLLVHELVDDFEINVAVLGDCGAKPSRLETIGATVWFLGSTKREPMPMRGLAASCYRLRALLNQLSPDVVHAWGSLADSVTSIAMGRASATPLIRSRFAADSASPAINQLVDRWGRTFDATIINHSSLSKSLHVSTADPTSLAVVPFGVAADPAVQPDARQRLRELAGIEGDVIISGTAAALTPRTRLKDLIWAADLLACIRPDFHFCIFGTGPQLQRLRRFAYQTEAAGHVHFLGTPTDTVDMIGALDIYWHSHLGHPLPTMLMHAMDRGVPAVSVLGPETSELIEHQRTGLAVNFGARDEFARWSKYLIELPDSAKQLGSQGQQHVRRKFPIEAMASEYQKIYREIG